MFDGEPLPPAEPPPPPTVTPAGAIGMAMRAAGFPVDRIQLANPSLLKLIEAGAPPELFAEVAGEAVRASKTTMGWVCGAVAGRMRDAAALSLEPTKGQGPAGKAARGRRDRDDFGNDYVLPGGSGESNGEPSNFFTLGRNPFGESLVRAVNEAMAAEDRAAERAASADGGAGE